MPEHTPSLVLEMLGTPPAYGEFCLTCQQPWPCPDAPTLAEVLDGHTSPVDTEWLSVACDDCGRTFPGIAPLEAHCLATHGHTAD